MPTAMNPWRTAVALAVLACGAAGFGELSRAGAAENAYLEYVRNAPEFKRVRQDPAMMIGRWDTWIYMPWRYQWTIGTGDEGGQFSRAGGPVRRMADRDEGEWGARCRRVWFSPDAKGVKPAIGASRWRRPR